MPVAFTVASFALDAGSYMMSGKTLTDHGLSIAMEEDCSMMRVLDVDDEICQEEQDYEVADAVLTPLPDGGDLDLSLARRRFLGGVATRNWRTGLTRRGPSRHTICRRDDGVRNLGLTGAPSGSNPPTIRSRPSNALIVAALGAPRRLWAP